MPQVAAILTSWTDKNAFARDVHAAFLRVGVPPLGAPLFTAHSALSTGWGKSIYNWNLAGLKLCSGCENTYDYVILKGTEVVDGVETPKTDMKWRAFNTLDEGVAALWKNLQASRYDSARALLARGDPEYFAEVGRNGWYTASPAQMKSEMTARLAVVQTALGVGGTAEASLGGVAKGAIVGLGLWYLWKTFK